MARLARFQEGSFCTKSTIVVLWTVESNNADLGPRGLEEKEVKKDRQGRVEGALPFLLFLFSFILLL